MPRRKRIVTTTIVTVTTKIRTKIKTQIKITTKTTTERNVMMVKVRGVVKTDTDKRSRTTGGDLGILRTDKGLENLRIDIDSEIRKTGRESATTITRMTNKDTETRIGAVNIGQRMMVEIRGSTRSTTN